MSARETIERAAAALAQRGVDPGPRAALAWARLPGSHGPRGAGRVYRLRAGARAWIVKRAGSERAYTQARDAYTRWCPALARPGEGPPTPALLAHDDDARILVLSDEPGAPADLGPRAPAVHRQLGVILRRLHGLPRDDRDPLPLREAARRRLAAGLARAESALRPAERAALERRFAGADALADARRVPCHRDVGPHNLLVSTGQGGAAPRVILIDFEHARLDVWAADLVKLACGPWRARPELAEAFAAGYGRAPLRESSTRALASKEAYAAALDPALVCCVLLHAVATIAWGRAHAEPELLAQGRAALAVAGV